MAASLPPDPPSSFSAADFDKLIASIATKVGVVVKADTKFVTPWRWIAGISPFDGAAKSIRDNLEALVKFSNATRTITDSQAQAIIDLQADVQALKEAPAARPFP